ncbi:uncharacterized protein LOC108222467 [Daucus carota subsp. sativus]|nr:PREDICTED: uncharacterized protein LOC108222467 [Daucus carota subsp. sativus]
MAGEYSDYDDDYSGEQHYALVDYGTTDPETNSKSEGYSGEQHHALGNYGTSYSKSLTQSGGKGVNVYQQTYRAKNEDKQTGSYKRFTAKDKAVAGEPFVDRCGNRGHKDEHTTSATYKVGDKRGYTEYYREERVKHVDFDKRSRSNNKAVGSYRKYQKY